jgi:DNA modification methylase
MPSVLILQGNALARLRALPAGSAHVCLTSPPYWSLRDYKTAGVSWPDGWHGELGQEPDPAMYVHHLVLVFREVRRVLHASGTVYLNLGDSYSNGRVEGLKHKDLVGIPWMVAFALRDDGWHLRADNVWAKGISFVPGYSGSCMPESVDDRTTRAHEFVFQLAKSEDYFCDMHAVRERGIVPAGTMAAKGSGTREGNRRQAKGGRTKGPGGYVVYDGFRNLRSVWAIGGEPFNAEFCVACDRLYDGDTRNLMVVEQRNGETIRHCVCGRTDSWLSHFATFPEDLAEPCIMAGTSAGGCCPRCRSPRYPVIEARDGVRTLVDWRWSCLCQAGPPRPCTVLDPFTGRGTSAIVALRHGREFVGCELNYDYARMAVACIKASAPLFSEDVALDKEQADADERDGSGGAAGVQMDGADAGDREGEGPVVR